MLISALLLVGSIAGVIVGAMLSRAAPLISDESYDEETGPVELLGLVAPKEEDEKSYDAVVLSIHALQEIRRILLDMAMEDYRRDGLTPERQEKRQRAMEKQRLVVTKDISGRIKERQKEMMDLHAKISKK